MDNRFEPLSMGEVLSINESAQILIGHRTFRVSEFAEAIRTQLEYGVAGWTEDKNAWFSEQGIPCEVLRFSSGGWQKGKVRINLEFCPLDADDEDEDASASFDADFAPNTMADSEDDLDLGDALSADVSTDLDDEFALASAALASTEVETDLEESSTGDAAASLDDEFAFPPATDLDDDQDLVESSINQLDELDLGTPSVSDEEFGQEDPTALYIEMEQEAITIIPVDELDATEMPSSLDDEFDLGEISESIEQELELVENQTVSDEDLLDFSNLSAGGEDDLDFGNMSAGGEDDLDFGSMSAGGEDDLDFGNMSAGGEDDLDFGDMSVGGEDEFQLEEFSLNNESENNEGDSLLDDVWQDMNEASWQNK